MKKFITSLLLIFFIAAYFFLNKNPCANDLTKVYEIENKKYCLLTASNQEQWTKGLMNYWDKKELNGADGMIFIFPDKQKREFWNKNTYLDLNIYWLDGNKVVGKDLLPSIEKSKKIITVSSLVAVDKVIELYLKK
jgi:uncharacterized membrane protein (UPF0127 family)